MKNTGFKIAGTGHYVPDRILTNNDLAEMVDTNDEWIFSRTGIRERHICAEGQTTCDMGIEAAKRALDEAGLQGSDIDLIIFATLTPDKPFPNNGSLLQAAIACPGAAAFSLEAGCTGFVYAMETAAGLMSLGHYKNALIVGAEKLSSIVNWEDRNTCVLFGDGAGAAVLTACAPEESCYKGGMLASDGNYHDVLEISVGGSLHPHGSEGCPENGQFIGMRGREVFKLAVTNMAAAATHVVEEAGLTLDDIDWVIPHQANIRIIDAVGERLGLPKEKVFANVHKYGNTSAASVPIALDELRKSGQVKPGQKVVLVAFGGGLTWGANLIQF